MSDLECPYCGEDNEVCHDDGFGYAENEKHEMQCSSCERYFIFTTFISFDYNAQKADCLNGSAHNLKLTTTYPKRFSKMQCVDCDYAECLPKDHPYLHEPKITI